MVDEEGGMRENNEDGRGGRNKVEQQSVRERESTATTDEEGRGREYTRRHARRGTQALHHPRPSAFGLGGGLGGGWRSNAASKLV